MTPMLTAAFLLLSSAVAPVAPPSALEDSCGPDDTRLLVLGSFHMDNPGQDSYDLQADDVLAPKRQREIGEVLDRLAAYAPTKVAIEGAFVGSTWPDRYKRYLKDDYALGRNEIEQIAFRLGRRLGHAAVHPIDFPMWMDGRVPAEIGEAKPRPAPERKAAEPDGEEPPAIFREMEQVLKTGSILDALRFVNSERYLREDQALYVKALRPDPYSNELYGKTNSIANWYKRNLRMFTNLYRFAEPRERLLLVVGSGHGSILRRLAIDAPDVCLVDTAVLLR